MKTKYTVKNFKIFDEKGANVEFAPLTILTGCNSSGKSSIVKSVLLLDSYMKELKQQHEQGLPITLKDGKLDFSQYPNNLLGRYQDVLNRKSQNNAIEFSYSIYSYLLGADVTVELTFKPSENDILDNGYLNKIVVKQDNNIIYFSEKDGENWMNFNVLKQAFIDFILLQSHTDFYLGLESAYEIDGDVSKDEYKKLTDEYKTFIKLFDKNRYWDVVHYMRFHKKNPIVRIDSLSSDLFSKIIDGPWLIYIPIVDELSSLTKDEAIHKLKDLISEEENPKIRKLLSNIVAKFNNSSANNFGQFYTDLESDWLNHIKVYECFFKLSSEPFVPNSKSIYISQAEMMLCIQNSETIDLWDNKKSTSKENEDNEELERLHPFELDYSILMKINELSGASYETEYYDLNHSSRFGLSGVEYEHYILRYMGQFISELIEEVLLPKWSNTLKYISSSRADIKRLYDLQINNDFTFLLKSYFDNRRLFNDYLKENHSIGKRCYEADTFMNKWVDKFGIGKAIKLEMDTDGVGVKIRLIKSNGEESLLANEGYGITQLASILLQIENAILSAKAETINRYWNQSKLDGYDVSKFHYAEQTLLIEEPEIHLHPKYQSLLADMFVEATKEYNIHFVIETHSEYLIRRLQVMVAEGHIKSDEVSVCYVDEGGRIYDMGLQENGMFQEKFGPGFFDEAANSHMALLRRERRR